MMTSEELERRKAICRDCPQLRTRNLSVTWCATRQIKPGGKVICLPWAAGEYRKMLSDDKPNGGCPKWHEKIVSPATLPPMPPITATITMCRRPQLMCEMMDSLLECISDHSHIVRWIAMDDGSPSSDLYKLAERYPRLEIACNDMKGHPSALNQLFAMVETDYIFHLEDDWRFETPGRLLEACWSVLQHDPRIGVACLRGFHFGDIATPQGFTYGLHSYGPGSPWPGYSLNPGLQDLRKVRDAGPFIDEPDFERKYAKRFRDKGYELAHLNPPAGRSWIKHTGGSKSAYATNNTAR